jgi:RNA polymerase sigma factor (sigma-70 family)
VRCGNPGSVTRRERRGDLSLVRNGGSDPPDRPRCDRLQRGRRISVRRDLSSLASVPPGDDITKPTILYHRVIHCITQPIRDGLSGDPRQTNHPESPSTPEASPQMHQLQNLPTRSSSRAAQIADLYAEHELGVRRIVSRAVNRSTMFVEDACQYAWTQLLTHTYIDPTVPSTRSWVIHVAIHAVYRQCAITARETHHAPGDQDLPVEADLPLDERVLELVSAEQLLQGLTARERRFVGLQAAGLHYDEIASLEGVSLRTVERQLMRGKRKLRDAIPEIDDGAR